MSVQFPIEDIISLACAAARDDNDTLAGKVIMDLASSGAPAPDVGLGTYSDDELLKELRERFKGQGMAVRVVKDTPDEQGDDGVEPPKPAVKKQTRKKAAKKADADQTASEAGGDEAPTETATEASAAKGDDNDPFADDARSDEPEVTKDDVRQSGVALQRADPAAFAQACVDVGLTKLSDLDPSRYAEVKNAFDTVLAGLEA